LTPATLIGVSGRPIRALALSTDNEGVFAGDQWSESGAAQKSVAAAIASTNLFMTGAPSYSPSGELKIESPRGRIIDVGQSMPQSLVETIVLKIYNMAA
jgi:hypothetical protein